MFSQQIIGSDAFLDMPVSSQNLYFHLGMYADDDGFVNPKRVMRMVGAQDDDLKVLLTKRFLLPFENGVVVIKHWLIHNTIRHDRYKETQYLEEKKQLQIKDNRAYTELATNGLPSGNQRVPQVKLSKVKLSKDTIAGINPAKGKTFNVLGEEIIKALEGVDPKNKNYYGNKTQRKACDDLLREYGLEKVLQVIGFLPRANKLPYAPIITSPFELWERWTKLESFLTKKKGEIISKGKGLA
jgi:hypothetical protein